jgi:riboflavin kinase/FMN adenylyltransferase
LLRQHGYDHLRRDDQSVVTTGTFDGVHLGHQAILRYLKERAEERGGLATVVTFHPHPREVLSDEPVPLLTTIDERADLLAEHGVGRFVVLPFTRALSLLEPERYVREVLMEQVGLGEIVIGYDHRFGRGRVGDRALLEKMGERAGFSVDVIPEQIAGGVTLSSSEVRRALQAGEARRAAEMLGRPYSFAGLVVRGDGRGQTIGFPTANVQPEHPHKLIPAVGVYAVRVRTEGGGDDAWGGMMNVGRRPTFETDGALKAEVNLFGAEGDLYGRKLRVEVVERVRDEKRFGSVEDLVDQLGRDREASLLALGRVP